MHRWKDNPSMPKGLVYEGVQTEPMEYSGGSAAQSSLLHCFDELLGVKHEAKSGEMADFFFSLCLITTVPERNERRHIVMILPFCRCLFNSHEKLHATCSQATDPGHLVATLPKEFCPAAGQRAAKPGLSALCHKTVGFAQLPHQCGQPLHHCTRSPRPTTSQPEPGLRGGDDQQSTHIIRGEGHRWLWHHDLP